MFGWKNTGAGGGESLPASWVKWGVGTDGKRFAHWPENDARFESYCGWLHRPRSKFLVPPRDIWDTFCASNKYWSSTMLIDDCRLTPAEGIISRGTDGTCFLHCFGRMPVLIRPSSRLKPPASAGQLSASSCICT